MKSISAYFFFFLYILAPFFSGIFLLDILETNPLNFENIENYTYFVYALYWLIMIFAMISIKYLFGGSLLGLFVIFASITFISSISIDVWNRINPNFLLTFVIQFIKNIFFYWLINLPFQIIKNKRENISKDKISPKLFECFRKEIIFNYEEQLSNLPKLAWSDYSISGYLYASMINILDVEIQKIKPEMVCSFENKNYENLFNILFDRLKSQYPEMTSHFSSTVHISYGEMKSKEGFKKGMLMTKEEFLEYLNYCQENYSLHPDKIDRSNMVPDTAYNVEKGLKKAQGKIQDTLYNLKGTSRLKKKIEELKSLKEDKTIDEKEYLKLRKTTLEKYVSEQTKDTNILKNKLKEVEQLKEDEFINQNEFEELRKIVISKYA